MAPTRYLLAVYATALAGGCFFVIDRLDDGKRSGGLECSSPDECVGAALPCNTHDPAKCGCGTFKRCESGLCSWVSIDCISRSDAGTGGNAGACLKSADCPGAEPLCDAVDPAACGCGAFRRCESGLCTTANVACPPVCNGYDQTCNDDPEISFLEGVCLANGTCSCRTGTKVNPATGRCRLDSQKPDAGGGGPVKCLKSADCPGAEPLCDAVDPAACGCGAFRRCESGLCTTANVACPPVCKYGYDQTCNDDPEISFLEGVCLANETCSCRTGTKVNPATGRCRLDSQKPDAGTGGNAGACLKSADCPGAEPLCDAVDPAACGCGAFRRCESGLCTTAKVACPPVCNGYDQTCNDDPEISFLEGVCLANGTCSCRTGTKVNPATGRCRLDSQKPDAGGGSDAGECRISADCPSDAPTCEASYPVVCEYGKCKSCQSGRCIWTAADCYSPDAGGCRSAADCPSETKPCDAFDLASCGCGAFTRCEAGRCIIAKVECFSYCTPGKDQTCNDDLAVSSLEGVCLANGTCSCRPDTKLNPATGRCRLN